MALCAGMMANYKTEWWISETGQVAQTTQDYSGSLLPISLTVGKRLFFSNKIKVLNSASVSINEGFYKRAFILSKSRIIVK
jgi:hypothetical protein